MNVHALYAARCLNHGPPDANKSTAARIAGRRRKGQTQENALRSRILSDLSKLFTIRLLVQSAAVTIAHTRAGALKRVILCCLRANEEAVRRTTARDIKREDPKMNNFILEPIFYSDYVDALVKAALDKGAVVNDILVIHTLALAEAVRIGEERYKTRKEK